MEKESFAYKGKEYQIEKVAELKPEAGKRCIQVTTQDNRQFKLAFNENLYRWVITGSTK